MTIDPRGVKSAVVPEEYARRLRASYYLVGAMLGCFGQAEVAYPRRAATSATAPSTSTSRALRPWARPMSTRAGRDLRDRADNGLRGRGDLPGHALRGRDDQHHARRGQARTGNTVIVNAAKEPHIVDLANFLNAMGGSRQGRGHGRHPHHAAAGRMHGCTYAIIPDQIEAGTLMIAAAATRGDVIIRGAHPHAHGGPDRQAPGDGRLACDEDVGEDSIRVRSERQPPPRSTSRPSPIPASPPTCSSP